MQFLNPLAWALVAPAFVVALDWDGPQATYPPQADNWSPAPTSPPRLYDSVLELFKRQQQQAGDNTCGYISGSYSRSLTCNNHDYVCATNSVYGVHGCCDPASLDSCTLPTTCVPSSSLDLCTGACLTNAQVAKCTDPVSPYCYNWLYAYSTTTMTEFGCYISPFTSVVERTYTIGGPSSSSAITSSAAASSSSIDSSTSSLSSSASSTTSSAAASSTTASSSKSSTPVGAIAGGVVGGLAVIAAAAAGIIYLFLSSKKKNNPENPAGAAAGQGEYKPPGAHPNYGQQQFPQQGYAQQPGNTASFYQQPYFQDVKPGYGQQPTPEVHGNSLQPGQPSFSPPLSPAPQYNQPGQPHYVPDPHGGVMQLDSTPIPGHPGPQIYEAPAGHQ